MNQLSLEVTAETLKVLAEKWGVTPFEAAVRVLVAIESRDAKSRREAAAANRERLQP